MLRDCPFGELQCLPVTIGVFFLLWRECAIRIFNCGIVCQVGRCGLPLPPTKLHLLKPPKQTENILPETESPLPPCPLEYPLMALKRTWHQSLKADVALAAQRASLCVSNGETCWLALGKPNDKEMSRDVGTVTFKGDYIISLQRSIFRYITPVPPKSSKTPSLEKPLTVQGFVGGTAGVQISRASAPGFCDCQWELTPPKWTVFKQIRTSACMDSRFLGSDPFGVAT